MQIDADRASYWYPGMFAKSPITGEYHQCRGKSMAAYYRLRGRLRDDQTKVFPFPPGLRMIAGQAGARAKSAGTEQSGVEYALVSLSHSAIFVWYLEGHESFVGSLNCNC